MECNRDEALRVKEMAESKFLVKDFKGAKKFALKAKNLYPELDGISQMLMTLDVYISAQEEKIHGESNWYGVLGVNPFSDDETIRKQYRKLALLLHPDKNRSIGAEGAFQLISQAWSLLSDKSRKMAYDRSCGRKFQHNNSKHDASKKPEKKQGGGFHDFVKSVSGDSKKRKNPPSSAPHSSHTMQEKETFWTVCHRCKMQYEYLRMYINHNLLCPNCNEAYFATEIAPPSNIDSKTLFQNSGIRHRKSKHSSGSPDYQWIPFSKSPGGGAPSAVQAANLVQQAFEKVKRERQKAQAAARKQEALLRRNLSSKRMRTESSSAHVNTSSSKRFKGAEQHCSVDDKQDVKPHLDDFKQLLMEKARSQIREKLMNATDGIKSFAAVDENVGPQPEGKSVEKASMDVPDSDFHDFEVSRRAESFGSDQVWAVYDDDDGMPRHYARIHEVISLKPFGVRLSWLRPITHRDGFSHVSWYANGFSKTCGRFQMGRTEEIFNSVDCFSHIVVERWKDGSDTVLIYPRRGEVWALYRNWSLDWNELTEYEVVHKYDIVEVLEDHDEELGVIVVPLVKAAGSRAVFCRHFDPSRIQRIPAGEISRFSHQLPSRSFTGDERGLRLLKGFKELDPAAVPSEILEAASSLNLDAVEGMS